MTVGELIKILSGFEPDAKILCDGCQQCVHQITGAKRYHDKGCLPEVWLQIKV